MRVRKESRWFWVSVSRGSDFSKPTRVSPIRRLGFLTPWASAPGTHTTWQLASPRASHLKETEEDCFVVCLGHPNKIPTRRGGFNKFTSQFWRLKFQDQGVGRGGFSVLAVQMASVSLCPRGFCPVCAHPWYLSSYEDTSPIGLEPTLRISFNLVPL